MHYGNFPILSNAHIPNSPTGIGAGPYGGIGVPYECLYFDAGSSTILFSFSLPPTWGGTLKLDIDLYNYNFGGAGNVGHSRVPLFLQTMAWISAPQHSMRSKMPRLRCRY